MQVVAATNDHPWRIAVLDVAGGTLFVLIAALTFWVAFVRVGEAQSEGRELRSATDSARDTLLTVSTAAARQEMLATERRKDLANRGRLPAAAPTEEYLSALAGLAAQHRLNVLNQAPGGARRYGEVTEDFYSYVVTGTLPDILRFLRAVEELPFWADVSYLRIEGGAVGPDLTSTPRRASLIFSLFANAAAPPAPTESAP